MYQVTDSDMRELEAAERAVTGLRRELQTAETHVQEIRARMQMAETQLSNAIRRVLQGGLIE